MRKFRRPLLAAALVAIAGLGVAYAGGAWIDRRGVAFFDTGQAVVDHLARVSRALQARDGRGLAVAFSATFEGTDLALGNGPLVADHDGVRQYRWTAPGAAVAGRVGASEAWTAYRDRFASLDEIALHLERLESWSDPGAIDAIVRFEAIGTPLGEARAGIDRARFRMRFERTPGAGVQIRRASLLDGERIISDHPAFEDVARGAGIDFVNAYYPPFIS